MEKVILLIEMVAGALLLWRTIYLFGTIMEALDVHMEIDPKDEDTKRRLNTMRDVERRNNERVRDWEEHRRG